MLVLKMLRVRLDVPCQGYEPVLAVAGHMVHCARHGACWVYSLKFKAIQKHEMMPV